MKVSSFQGIIDPLCVIVEMSGNLYGHTLGRKNSISLVSQGYYKKDFLTLKMPSWPQACWTICDNNSKKH